MKHVSILATFILIVVGVVFPILTHPYLPLVDLPNHIARLFIAANPTSVLRTYFDYNLGITPNSAVDLLWYILGYPLGLEKFSQIVMAVYAVNFLVAVMVLARVVQKRWTIWPATAALLVYNAPFYWGFQNYLFSVPFAIYGLTLWIVLEGRSNGLRVTLFVPFCLLLFVMHLFAFALLATAVLGREVQRIVESSPGWRRTLSSNLVLSVPFVIPVGLLAYNIGSSGPNPESSRTQFGNLFERWHALSSPFGGNPGSIQISGMVALVLLLALFLFARRKTGPRLIVTQSMTGPLVALFLLSVFSPFWVNGVAFVNIRFPFVLMAIFIAATHWRGVSTKFGAFIGVSLSLVLFVRVWEFDRLAAEYSGNIQNLNSVLEFVPDGARILPMRGPGMRRDVRYAHVHAFAVPRAQAFIPTLFQGVHLLSLKKEWTNYAHSGAFLIDSRHTTKRVSFEDAPIRSDLHDFWANWQEKFTHVLSLDAAESDLPESPSLEQIAQSGRFTLFRVRSEN